MKHMKILGLAVVAATALMTFLGAGPASATVLCKTASSPCPETYPVGTYFYSSLEGTGVWEESSGTIFQKCTSATIKTVNTNKGGSGQSVKMAILSAYWGNPESTCTKTTDFLKWGELEIHWISGTENGTVTDVGTEWTVGSCVYGFNKLTDLGTIKGGNPARLELNALVPPISGPCFTSYRWTATFTIWPQPLYVVSS